MASVATLFAVFMVIVAVKFRNFNITFLNHDFLILSLISFKVK